MRDKMTDRTREFHSVLTAPFLQANHSIKNLFSRGRFFGEGDLIFSQDHCVWRWPWKILGLRLWVTYPNPLKDFLRGLMADWVWFFSWVTDKWLTLWISLATLPPPSTTPHSAFPTNPKGASYALWPHPTTQNSQTTFFFISYPNTHARLHLLRNPELKQLRRQGERGVKNEFTFYFVVKNLAISKTIQCVYQFKQLAPAENAKKSFNSK